MPTPLFSTERLDIRPWTAADLDAAWAIYGDPEVMRYVADGVPHADREQTLAWLRRREDGAGDPSGLGVWAVVDRATGEAMGSTLLIRFGDTDDVEVGYQFRHSAWGQGYATEVARATIRHGFEALGLPRIVAVAYPANVASQRVLEKAGMRRAGTVAYRGLEPVYFTLERGDWQG